LNPNDALSASYGQIIHYEQIHHYLRLLPRAGGKLVCAGTDRLATRKHTRSNGYYSGDFDACE
jgi:hypothetical protein